MKTFISVIGSMFVAMFLSVASYASVTLSDGRVLEVPNIDPAVLYTDYFGATAYGWEIEENIRKNMLECGGESEADIYAHCETDLKQLLYTQTVGGYDDWGLTLHEVTFSHGYYETCFRIWDQDATPTDKIRAIYWDVWCNGYTSDFRVQNYRSGWYHSTVWSTPAYQIGDSFYSINNRQDFSMFDLNSDGSLVRYDKPEWDWFEIEEAPKKEDKPIQSAPKVSDR